MGKHAVDGLPGLFKYSDAEGMGLQYELNTFERAVNDGYLRKVANCLRKMFPLPRGITIDSGAAEHVIPKGLVNSIEVKPSPGSIRGVHYVAASGTRIPNLGEQKIPFWTLEGIGASWLFQVAGVNKPLASVAKLIDEGWRIIFDSEGSFIKHKKTGRIIKLVKERGVFIIPAYLVKDPKSDNGTLVGVASLAKDVTKKNGQVFIGQGI